MVVVDHANEHIVEDADAEDLVGLLDARPENNRANCDSYVVRSHLVVRLILDKLLKELNEELKGIIIKFVLCLHRIDLFFYKVESLSFFYCFKFCELLIIFKRNQGFFHFS